MKMGRVSDKDLDKAIENTHKLNKMIDRFNDLHFTNRNSDVTEKFLDRLIDTIKDFDLLKIISGYQVLSDNCCDKELSYLEFNPEIKKALERD